MHAAQHGYEDVCARLILAGASINDRKTDGDTPLFMAALNGHYRVCTMLALRGADVHVTTDSGATALFAAAQAGSVDCCRLLLEMGAAVDALRSDGVAPLCVAASCGHLNVCTALLAAGAVASRANVHGVTALHVAARGHADICRLLLNHGADIRLCCGGQVDGAAAGGYERPTLRRAVLIKADANVTAVRADGLSALTVAAGSGHSDVCWLLLDHGANAFRLDPDNAVDAQESQSHVAGTATLRLSRSAVAAGIAKTREAAATGPLDDMKSPQLLLPDAAASHVLDAALAVRAAAAGAADESRGGGTDASWPIDTALMSAARNATLLSAACFLIRATHPHAVQTDRHRATQAAQYGERMRVRCCWTRVPMLMREGKRETPLSLAATRVMRRCVHAVAPARSQIRRLVQTQHWLCVAATAAVASLLLAAGADVMFVRLRGILPLLRRYVAWSCAFLCDSVTECFVCECRVARTTSLPLDAGADGRCAEQWRDALALAAQRGHRAVIACSLIAVHKSICRTRTKPLHYFSRLRCVCSSVRAPCLL